MMGQSDRYRYVSLHTICTRWVWVRRAGSHVRWRLRRQNYPRIRTRERSRRLEDVQRFSEKWFFTTFSASHSSMHLLFITGTFESKSLMFQITSMTPLSTRNKLTHLGFRFSDIVYPLWNFVCMVFSLSQWQCGYITNDRSRSLRPLNRQTRVMFKFKGYVTRRLLF